MKRVFRQWLAGLLSVVLLLTLLPATALAEEADGATGPTAVEQVQTLIDTLPDADAITADNRADVQAQIDAIDAAMAELTGDEVATLDTARYDAAVAALLALDAPSALEQVQALIDALPDAAEITAENRDDVQAQIDSIDAAMLELSVDEAAALDTARYDAAVAALLALDTPSALEQVQALIDALPDAESITDDNRADVQAQIDAIDAAILELTEDQAAALDTARYDAAVAALLALDAPSALEQVQALIDALPDAESITADNRADVEAQLTAIDEAKQGLSDEEVDALDITRYMAAVEAILALDDMAGADEPVTIVMESDITYLDWDDGQKRLVEKTCDSATKVESSTTTWDNNWYVVSGRVTISDRIIVTGTVHLILMDGCALTASKGIQVYKDNSLTIYGQSAQTGSLSAIATSANDAGIGGGYWEKSGTITINGGNITAQSSSTDGAGIGGGGYSWGGTTIINGGSVIATGSDGGAGIGGGWNGSGGTITINGGSVTATGGKYGTGIGGGYYAGAGTITINGGSVTATGGEEGAVGIGKGLGGGEGSFSTGTDGNAVIVASGISDKSQQDSWSGIIIEGDTGKIYGTPTPEYNFEIPSGKTLNVENGHPLHIAEGITMINKGTINVGTKDDMNAVLNNEGSIINEGKIDVWGLLTHGEDGIRTQNSGQIIYHFNLDVDAPTFEEAKYGYLQPQAQEITIKNTGEVNATITSVEIIGSGFILNTGNNATLETGHSDESWTVQPEANLSVGTHTATISVTYSGSGGGTSRTATAKVTFTVVKAETNLTAAPVTYTYGTDGGITLTATVAPAAANGISLMSAGQNQVVFSFPKGDKTMTVNDVPAGGGTASVTIPAEDVKDYFNRGVNTVTVSYGGSGNLKPKESVNCTVTVNPKALDYTFTVVDKTYDGDTTVTGSLERTTALVGSDSVTESLQAGAATAASANAGTQTVTVDTNKVNLSGADAEYYKVGNIDGGTVDISKAIISSVTTPTVTNPTYNGQDQALLTGVASGVPEGATITYFVGAKDSNAEPTGTEDSWNTMESIKAKDAGTYTVWYKVTGGMNYEDIEPTEIDEATIEQKPVTLTWSGHTELVYTGTAKNVTATFLDDEIEDGDKGEVSVSVTDGDRVEANPDSTYIATATLEGNRADNYKLTNNMQTYTISKATPTVTVTASDTPTYGSDITLTAAVTSGAIVPANLEGTVTFKAGGTTLGTGTSDGTGKWTLTLTEASNDKQKALFDAKAVTADYSGNSNIESRSGTATVEVEPKTLTYTVTATSKDYDGSTTVIVELTPGNLVGTDSVTLTATGNLSSPNAATYNTVDLSGIVKGGADEKYYSVAETASGQTIQDGVTITPKMVELVWKLDNEDTFTINYDGKPHTATATVNNKVNSDEVEVTVEVKPDSGTGAGPYDATATDAGNYTATATELTGTAKNNYTLIGSVTTTQTITISKVLATCTAPAAKEGLSYTGTDNPLVEAGTTSDGTMMYALGDDGSTKPGNEAFDSDIPTGADAKTYYVWYYVQGDGNHDDSGKACVEVTIAPAKVSFTIGTENKDDWGAKGEANADPNPTGYTLEGSGTEYKLSMIYDSYGHKANVSQTADEMVKIAAGTVNGFTVTYKKDGTGPDLPEITDAGTYDIIVNLTPAENTEDVYNFQFNGQGPDVRSLKIGTVTVTPFTVHVTWSHLKYIYHAHPMHPTVKVQNAFNSDVQPTTVPEDFDPEAGYEGKLLAYAVTNGSDVGDYEVTVTLYGTSAGNYTVEDATGTVSILAAPVTFTVGDNIWDITKEPLPTNVTLRAAWGEVTTTPDVAVHHKYPGAGTKLDVGDLNTTIEYRKDGLTYTAPNNPPTEAGTYEVWVKIGNENYRHSATDSGDFHKVGELILTDNPASIKTYTITFAPNYDDAPNGPASMEKIFEKQTVIIPSASGVNEDGTEYDINRDSYRFLGWSYGGLTYQPNEEFIMPAGDVAFKAEWVLAVDVSGTVKQGEDESTAKALPGATVTLKNGAEEVAETTTDNQGNFKLEQIAPGTYNLEVRYQSGSAEIVKTFLVEVGESGSLDGTYLLPTVALNTVVEMTPGITAAVDMGGIVSGEDIADVYTTDDRETVRAGGTVEFKMTIQNATLTTGQAEEIPVTADRIGMVLDLELTKTVTKSGGKPTETDIHDTKIPVITVIHLPAELQGKSSYTIYRFHDMKNLEGSDTLEMQTITTSPNSDGEYLKVVQGGTAIEIHAEFYSTYVLTWQQSSGGGGGSSRYPVNLPSETDAGTITSNPTSAIPGSRVTLTVTPDEGYHLKSLTVTDRNGKALEVTDNGDGTYTFTQPYGQVTVKAEYVKCGSLDFTDLDASAWYHDYTDYVIAHGLMNGIGGGLFEPGGTVTRAQMVMVLWNMSGKPVVNYYMTYSDVSEDSWCAEAIRWATSEGIASGYGGGLFGPGDPITREQMAAMMYRYEQKYGDGGFTGDWMYRLPFTDLDQISDWAFEAVAWCNMKGVMNGKADNIFDPKGAAKRSELAAVLTRFCEEVTTAEEPKDTKGKG